MKRIGIVAGGPRALLANLASHDDQVDYWIGCDRGCLYLLDHELRLDLAIGDFDSVDEEELTKIKSNAREIEFHPIEKDLTDLELAINMATKLGAEELIIFGVTGGRKDHELSAIYLLEQLIEINVQGTIIDRQNKLNVFLPGTHQISQDDMYPKVSLIALTKEVTGLSLSHFYYELDNASINRGDSLTLSNHLIEQTGHVSFETGILIVIKSSEH